MKSIRSGKEKLCYILPVYDLDISEHHYYLYKFLQELSCRLDLFIIIEKSSSMPDFPEASVYRQRFRSRLLRLAELIVTIVYLRLRGYRRFYVHYSYPAAICTALLTRLTGGVNYYWNCSRVKDFWARWSWRKEVLKKIFSSQIPLTLAIRLSRILVTGTETMAWYYAREFCIRRSRIQVMPNWVDHTRFYAADDLRLQTREALGADEDKLVVLFVHWISERKGAHFLPEIIQRVSARLPQVLFVIAGRGPYEKQLQQTIGMLNLREKALMLGAVPNRVISNYYRAADLLIMPSEQEGFPRVLLEAMAAGVPFVATNVGGVPDIIPAEVRQFLVEKGDISQFCERVSYLLLHPEERQRLSRLGQEKVKEFYLTPTLNRFQEIIDNYISS